MAMCSVDGCHATVRARGLCFKHYQRVRRHGSIDGGGTPHGEPLRFIEESLKTDTNDCIVWPFARDRHGYGILQWNGKSDGAHRVACLMAHGPSTGAQNEAAHSCGMGHIGCINHKHLRWATHKENHADREMHGTNNAGEKCGSAKLSSEQINEIRASSESNRDIARRYAISLRNVGHIRSRSTWRHL